MSDRLTALRRLHEIGGDVEESEVVYHLGEAAIFELHEAEADGLVESKTTFTLTDRGGAWVKAEEDKR